jgi:AcrR family transcriptional regulator
MAEAAGQVRKRVGGRSARVHDAVLKSVFELLAEGGVENLSIAEVAARAGVHETSIYRRWPSHDLLILDACRHVMEDAIPIPNTGSLKGDLIALQRDAREMLGSSQGRVIIALTHLQNANSRARRHAYWQQRFEHLRPVFDRAVARGEFPGDADPIVAIQTLIAPLYFRFLVTVEPLDDWPIAELAERLVTSYAQPSRKKRGR